MTQHMLLSTSPLALTTPEATEIFRVLTSLAWPAVVLTALVLFRKELAALSRRVTKGKAGPVEIELDRELDQLLMTTAAATKTLPPAQVTNHGTAGTGESQVRDVLREATHSPKLALIELSAEIERRSLEVVASTGHLEGQRRPPFSQMLNRLELSPPTQEAARQFRQVRNRLVHGMDATEAEILRALDLGLSLLDAINRLPHEVHYVREPRVEVFRDEAGDMPVDAYHGVLLESVNNDGNRIIHAFPTTRDHFEKGKAVSWEWGEARYPEAWYRDPADGAIKYAWGGALEFVGRALHAL
jgi:hypothetical protein